MHAFVIDANAIKDFQSERISEDGDTTFIQSCMDRILNSGFIVIDDNKQESLILNEWYSCCSHSASGFSLEEWVLSKMQEGKIKLVELSKRADKRLLELGVPRKDHKYIILSCEVAAHSLITHDIDFHDPSAKSKKTEAKKKIKESKSGPVCKHLRKCCGVRVVDWCELSI